LFDCGDRLVTTDTGNGDDPTTDGAAVAAVINKNRVASSALDVLMPGKTARDVALKAGVDYIGAFNPEEETNTDNWAAGLDLRIGRSPTPVD